MSGRNLRVGVDRLRMRVDFTVPVHRLAVAMAIEARNECEYDHDEEKNDAVQVEYVNGIGRGRAFELLRECLHAYGLLSWPDDYSTAAYEVARDRVEGWRASGIGIEREASTR